MYILLMPQTRHLASVKILTMKDVTMDIDGRSTMSLDEDFEGRCRFSDFFTAIFSVFDYGSKK
jgi:hypothetical protein